VHFTNIVGYADCVCTYLYSTVLRSLPSIPWPTPYDSFAQRYFLSTIVLFRLVPGWLPGSSLLATPWAESALLISTLWSPSHSSVSLVSHLLSHDLIPLHLPLLLPPCHPPQHVDESNPLPFVRASGGLEIMLSGR
jgi:hypothetical protein